MDKKRKAKAARRVPAREAPRPEQAIDADWGKATELDPVDQYVIEHGEFPMSGDIVGPDVVDNTLFGGFNPPDDRPAE